MIDITYAYSIQSQDPDRLSVTRFLKSNIATGEDLLYGSRKTLPNGHFPGEGATMGKNLQYDTYLRQCMIHNQEWFMNRRGGNDAINITVFY